MRLTAAAQHLQPVTFQARQRASSLCALCSAYNHFRAHCIDRRFNLVGAKTSFAIKHAAAETELAETIVTKSTSGTRASCGRQSCDDE